MIDVAAFTGGWHVPSAKFRVRQYVDALAREGVRLLEHPAPLGVYPPTARALRPFWAAATLGARLPAILRARRADVTLLQREMLSTFRTLEGLTAAPRVLDVDDAIWLPREHATRRLAQLADVVICGNSYLAERFSAWNARVALLPTAVDTERYVPRPADAPPLPPTIGWIGTSSNFPYLETIEAALAAVLEARPDAGVLIVSDRAPRLRSLPSGRWRFLKWSSDREVADIQSMSIGLMPLHDTAWARGKCSFKMLTYMACSVPVVVSPVGMNVDVLAAGRVGLTATTTAEWVDAMVSLLDAASTRQELGREGRRVAEARYSVRLIAPQLAALLTGAARA